VAEALGLRPSDIPASNGASQTATTPELPDLPENPEEPDGQSTPVL
jgi:hypothetical protein